MALDEIRDEAAWNERAIGQKTWQRRQQNGEYDASSIASSLYNGNGMKKSSKKSTTSARHHNGVAGNGGGWTASMESPRSDVYGDTSGKQGLTKVCAYNYCLWLFRRRGRNDFTVCGAGVSWRCQRQRVLL